MKKETQYHTWYWVAAMIVIMIIQGIFASYTKIEQVPYSAYQDALKAGKIAEVRVSGNYIQGTYKKPDESDYSEFITNRVDPETAQELSKYDVKFSGAIESTFLRDLLSWIVPIALFFGVWIFMFRRYASQQGFGGLMSVGRSKAKVYVETDTKATFADVAGVDEAKAELQEIVEFLKNPDRYGRLGGRVPKGVLLVGPPGTGKTLLARAVAGEANVPFFSINGSEFVEMFVGVGAARVRDLFEQARQKAPCIVFIDELDALGRARGAYPGGGGHDEKEQTLNQLLSELDGFDSGVGMILLAATNRPEVLDPALLRAGRFDRQVLVDRPDKLGRVQVLQVHVRKIRLAPEVDLETVAALTPGFTGADLANLVNEAALLATRRGADSVSLADFTGAMERIVAGLEKRNRLLNPHEREVVAYHEMGHALVALSLPGSDKVHKVSIIPRGIGSLGYTIQRPTEDRFLMTRKELDNKMAVLLGGRAAEEVVFGELSTGAADDLGKVTDIARSIVTRYGMTEELGQVVYEKTQQNFLGGAAMPPLTYAERSYGEETARQIDNAVKAIVDQAFRRTVTLLRAKHDTLERGARLLLEHETLDESDLTGLLQEPVAAQ
ncbi:MAG: ATP-dependent zinc metalloprotease FtsH [Alphaproteobacteria bacterium]|nr:ATP-dependent zinc metalloprotease FtsH [Alphaproteobacteria bacterium]